MLNLFFVRHGETEWNVQHRLQGQLDSPLTPSGINDAQLLAKRLATTPFDVVLSSSSNRAVQTAKILIENRSLAVKSDERLMEINLGNWQGKTIEEIKAIDSVKYNCYVHDPKRYRRDDGAENFEDVQARLENFLEDMEQTYPSGNVLIVTHGVVIKVLQMICKKNSLDQLWDPPIIDGTSLTTIQVQDGKRKLLLEGDVTHKRKSFGL